MVKYSETISVSPDTSRTERLVSSQLNYDATKRYNTEVRMTPCLKPTLYSNSVVCFSKNATGRYYVNSLHLKTSLKPRAFAECIAVFPKIEKKTFVTAFRVDLDTSERWFCAGIDLDPRDFATANADDSENEAQTTTTYDTAYHITKTRALFPKTVTIVCSEDDANNNSYVSKWSGYETEPVGKKAGGNCEYSNGLMCENSVGSSLVQDGIPVW